MPGPADRGRSGADLAHRGPTAGPADRADPGARVPRWIAYLFAALAIVLVPAVIRVIADAPPLLRAANWRLAWGGFDVGLAVMLAATGLALLRRSGLAAVLAAATAALLGCDAWLDTLSSLGMGRGSLLSAIAEAVLVELPLMVILLWVAAGTVRGPANRLSRRPRWLPGVFIVLALALGPWIGWLFISLPNTVMAAHWDVIRAGFMIALAILLAASAVALFRQWASARLLAAMTAALLVRDAWFNTLTAARPPHSGLALGVALLLELPLAGLCGWVSVRQAGPAFRVADRPATGPSDIGQPIAVPDPAGSGPRWPADGERQAC